jgi:hypothetical protein
MYNSSYHLLFDRICFSHEREVFYEKTDDACIAREAAIVGKNIYMKMCDVAAQS